MSDADLLTLERAIKADPSDLWAHYRWRCALVAAGRAAEAGFQNFDVVELTRAVFGPDGSVLRPGTRLEVENCFMESSEDGLCIDVRLGAAVSLKPIAWLKLVLPVPPDVYCEECRGQKTVEDREARCSKVCPSCLGRGRKSAIL